MFEKFGVMGDCAAIAAHELSVTVTAHSDGIGTGATFTLKLSIKTTEDAS